MDSKTSGSVFSVLFEGLGFLLLALVVVVLVRRWRSATPAARRLLGPVLLAGGATLFFFALSIVVYPLSSGAADLISLGFLAGFVATPFVFLWGILRSRLARSEVGALLGDSAEAPTLVETQEARGPPCATPPWSSSTGSMTRRATTASRERGSSSPRWATTAP